MKNEPFTKDDFLDLWRQVLPKMYTDPIENEANGQGFDIPSLQAAIFARFEAAVNTNQQAYFLRRHSNQTGEIARAGAKARGTVYISRPSGDAAVTVPRGTILIAEQRGTVGETVTVGRYLTTHDATLGEGDAGPVAVEVEAEFPGYSGNLEFPGMIVRIQALGRATVKASANSTSRLVRNVAPAEESQWDDFSGDLLGRYVRVVQLSAPLNSSPQTPRRVIATWSSGSSLGITISPALATADVGKVMQVEIEEWEDLGLTVVQPQPILGGRGDTLGALANDFNVGRVAGETDDQLAMRLTDLPDTVSPSAIERTVGNILDPLGIGWCLKETGDVDSLMGFTFDVHPYDATDIKRIQPILGSQLIGQGAVWLDRRRQFRFFIVCVHRSGLGEFGFGYDYTDSSAPNAWDIAAYDGKPLGFLQAVGRVQQAVDGAREGGVGFLVKVDCC